MSVSVDSSTAPGTKSARAHCARERKNGGHYSDEAAVWLVAQLADALPIG